MDGTEDEKRWAEAFRAGEPLPSPVEWELRRRALRAAIAEGDARPSRRRLSFWIPAAAAAGILAAWGLRAWRPDVPPPSPAPVAATAAGTSLAETAAAARGIAEGVTAALDGAVPLVERLAGAAGERIAGPLRVTARRAAEDVREGALSATRDLVAWSVETSF